MALPLLRPFSGLRPAAGRAADVIAPPYDVVGTEEARQRAQGRPHNFLHVSKPEIDFPPGADPHAPEIYAKASENLSRLVGDGVLIRDPKPCYYVYRLIMGDHQQTGLVAAASLAAYDSGRIRRHELTRPDKQDDRRRQIEAVNAHTGPVMMANQPNSEVAALLCDIAARPPEFSVEADDEVVHTLWVVSEEETIGRISTVFGAMDALYIGDGHHRLAAASGVCTLRRAANPDHRGDEPYNFFLAVTFPTDEMRILEYDRLVRDLNGSTVGNFLDRVGQAFDVEPNAKTVHPAMPHEFGMYLAGHWYRLKPREVPPHDAPVNARLDISLLSAKLLTPVLGIGDPRLDPRIDFVGGTQGIAELVRRVDSGEMAVGFALHPTEMGDLIAVADAMEVMPPKSTWFEPKLADGLISHLLA